MSFINCKRELKLKWMNYGADNANANSNNIISTIKDAKLFVSVIILSTKSNQNHQNVLGKGLKDQCIGMNKKQKVRIKIRQTSIDSFFNKTL